MSKDKSESYINIYFNKKINIFENFEYEEKK